MRAITVLPGVANSARLDEVSDPPASDGAILARSWALGVCGTDREIVSGAKLESESGTAIGLTPAELAGVALANPFSSFSKSSVVF